MRLVTIMTHMAGSGLPEFGVARVQRWCSHQVPERLRGEIRVECDIGTRHLTICECRPPWHDLGPEWTRFPIARLHHTKTTGLWTLYWRDRNLKFHRYQPLDPSPRRPHHSSRLGCQHFSGQVALLGP